MDTNGHYKTQTRQNVEYNINTGFKLIKLQHCTLRSMIFTLPSRSSKILQISKNKGKRCMPSNLDIKMSKSSFHMFSFIILLIIE